MLCQVIWVCVCVLVGDDSGQVWCMRCIPVCEEGGCKLVLFFGELCMKCIEIGLEQMTVSRFWCCNLHVSCCLHVKLCLYVVISRNASEPVYEVQAGIRTRKQSYSVLK